VLTTESAAPENAQLCLYLQLSKIIYNKL